MDITNRQGCLENKLFEDFLKNNNELSLRKLIVLMRQKYYRLIYKMTLDYDASDDIFQNTWLRIIGNSSNFDAEKGNFPSYFYRISYNESLKWINNEKRIFEENIEAAKYDPQEKLLEKEKNKDIIKAVFSMKQKYAETIYLFYFGEYSINRISEMMGIKPGTVKTRLKRGKNMLKKILSNVMELQYETKK